MKGKEIDFDKWAGILSNDLAEGSGHSDQAVDNPPPMSIDEIGIYNLKAETYRQIAKLTMDDDMAAEAQFYLSLGSSLYYQKLDGIRGPRTKERTIARMGQYIAFSNGLRDMFNASVLARNHLDESKELYLYQIEGDLPRGGYMGYRPIDTPLEFIEKITYPCKLLVGCEIYIEALKRTRGLEFLDIWRYSPDFFEDYGRGLEFPFYLFEKLDTEQAIEITAPPGYFTLEGAQASGGISFFFEIGDRSYQVLGTLEKQIDAIHEVYDDKED